MLALAWALTLTTSTLLTTIGPLSSKELGATDSLAAFTVGRRIKNLVRRIVLRDKFFLFPIF